MSAAPTSRSADLTVTVYGPNAADGVSTLDAHAREPLLWTVSTSQPVTAVDVAVGDRTLWRQAEWDGRTARVVLAGIDADPAGLPTGSYRTWVRVTHGEVVIVRPGGRLLVQ